MPHRHRSSPLARALLLGALAAVTLAGCGRKAPLDIPPPPPPGPDSRAN